MCIDGVGQQLCHLGDEGGGAHVEEGGDVWLDGQLLYNAGVCQVAETLPKLHNSHNLLIKLLFVQHATGH